MAPDRAITEALQRWAGGDRAAGEAAFRCVEPEIRRLARLRLRREGGASTLRSGEFVGHVWERLQSQARIAWRSRRQLLALAWMVIDRVLVDRARRRAALRRGAGRCTPLETAGDLALPAPLDPDRRIDLERALERLALEHPLRRRIVELKTVLCHENEEIARLLGVSESTVKREWRATLDWLREALAGRVAGPG